jgi:hypothetical protein
VKSKCTLVTAAIILYTGLQAQIVSVGSSGNMTIKPGTLFHTDGLSLNPSADFVLGNTNLSHNTILVNYTSNVCVSRVYKWSNTTGSFSGTAQINYLDAELNGLIEVTLQVNIHTGTTWQAVISATNDIFNNYVLSNSFTNTTLDEITLASQLTPLPLSWHRFTVQKQNNHSLLQWSTAYEQNTRDFIVQHSSNGNSWLTIATLQAAGNSTDSNYYSHLHTTPVKGVNFYRILQRDLDNRSSYSQVQQLKFDEQNALFEIITNPVQNGVLQILVNQSVSQPINLLSNDGKLIWSKQLAPGVHSLDLSSYAKGMYLLKAGKITEKLVLQ